MRSNHDPSRIHHKPLAALAAGRAAVLGHRDMGVLVMECDWKIGDRIVCIDDHNTSMDEQEIAEGCIYTIRWIGCDGFSGRAWGKHQSVDVCVRLVGVVRRGIDNPFAWTRFRPVRTIDTTATVAALAQAMREAMKKGMVDA